VAFWWLDRTLPGVVASLILSAVVWVSHVLTRRHITRVTERQNRHIERLTAEQTAALTGHKNGSAE
jgi:heme exporter protein D